MTDGPTCAERLLSLSAELGADYIFSSLGSDHPAFIEEFARLLDRRERMPDVIVCPHEIASASGDVVSFEVREREELTPALRNALGAVRSGRPAVVDVRIEPFSGQALGRQPSGTP